RERISLLLEDDTNLAARAAHLVPVDEPFYQGIEREGCRRCRWLPGTTADLTSNGGSVTALHRFESGIDPAGREEDEQQHEADVEHPLLACCQPRPLPDGARLMPDGEKLVVGYECHAPANLQCLCRGE